MKSRYLISAGAALAVAFGCAEANAQFAFMGGPYPTLFYVGPEGGWSEAEEGSGLAKVALGPTVLRSESAAVAAGVLLAALRSGLVRPAS